MADSLAVLYEKYNKLTEAKDVTELSSEYLECIEGTKGDEKEKRLAAQIIQNFFKHFPALQDQALNAILDLCEDDNSIIRIYAMKVLPALCKDGKKHIFKVADILAQLLQLEDTDYTVACNCLIQIFKEDPVTVCKGIFQHIYISTEDSAREKCISFLYKKLIKIQEKPTPELEDLLIEGGKKILQDSSAVEFCEILPYLKSSKLSKTVSGQQELVNLIAYRAELDREFDPFDVSNSIDRILMCVDCALPLFNVNVPSNKFLIYYCDQILPQWKNLEQVNNGDKAKIQILRQLAELSAHCGKLENPSLHVVQIFDKMKDYMPPPPEDADLVEMPNLDFTTVECLLYAFHRLARQCPDFLTADPLVLKDFRARLTYFSRGVQGCKKSLQAVLSKKVDLSKEDTEKAKIAPSVLNNINTLIKDLFYQPPVYKCNVVLSFKEETRKTNAERPAQSSSQKRHIPITFDASNGNAKQPRIGKGGDNVKIYTPPSGKFSNNFQSYDRAGGRPRGRGGRGTLRGRGRGTWRK